MIAQLTLLNWEKCLETNVKSEQSYGVMEAIEVMRAMVIVNCHSQCAMRNLKNMHMLGLTEI